MPQEPKSAPLALAHRDLGGEGSPPALLLHGMLGSSRNWQTAGRELGWSRRVYALDLRNHGFSPHAETMTYEAMAGDVLAWMDAHGLGRVEFIGHSMGGKVAMLLACRHPARVGRLVVVDIAPRDYQWPEHRAEFSAMAELDLPRLVSRADAESRMEPKVPGLGMRKFISTNLERLPEGGFRWQLNLPAISAALPELERNPLGPDDRYQGPTLFIAGGKSQYIRAADHAKILLHFPHARIVLLPKSGHNPHIDARDDFVKAVVKGG